MRAAPQVSRKSRSRPNRRRSDMATPHGLRLLMSSKQDRSRMGRAAAVAFFVELALFGGGYRLLTRKPPAPVEPPVTVLSLAPAPAPSPAPPANPPPRVDHPAPPPRHAARIPTPPPPAVPAQPAPPVPAAPATPAA